MMEHQQARQLAVQVGLYCTVEIGFIILQIIFIYIVCQVRYHLQIHPVPPMMYPANSPAKNLSVNDGGYCNTVAESDEMNQDHVKFQVATYEFEAPPPSYDAAK